MSQNVTGLSPRQHRAIEALLEGKTITDAAKVVDVSRKTMHVWLSQEEFRNELDRLGGLRLEETAHRMISLASDAIGTLEKVLQAKDVPVSNQIQAAKIALRRSSELWEIYNITKRVESIEAVLVRKDA